MAEFVDGHGNLLEADVEALINSVNTVGVMGKGIALQFKGAFPTNFRAYEAACKSGSVELGRMFVFDNGVLGRPRWIINFPTKGHWRANSRIDDVTAGLDDLRTVIGELKISSIALPALGCGNGGLSWGEVRPLIQDKLADLRLCVHLYPPEGAPAAADMTLLTPRPELTRVRAALVSIVDQYSAVAVGVSLIEIHKLMYFLQEAGEELRLTYRAERYGPYADNLRHLLKTVEGHYLQGFGDGSKRVAEAEYIFALPEAAKQATDYLAGHELLVERIESVLRLAQGFESAYGMELLATVHWIANERGTRARLTEVTEAIGRWSTRKRRMFTPSHIESAWTHLHAHGWLPAAA